MNVAGVNPLTLAWNAARDARNLAVFVAAMTRERVSTPSTRLFLSTTG